MNSPSHLPSPEPVHDVLRHGRRKALDAVFHPNTIALIGATERSGSVGSALLKNLRAFRGTIYPVNPKRSTVLGMPAIPNIAAAPEKVDLAIIATPSASVPMIVRECSEAEIPAAIIISAGFRETGTAGAELETQVISEARRGRIRIIGPNCLGVMSPHLQLNATFAAGMALPGSLAFISQSGALCTAILDWSLRENVGFSGFVSIGSMADVDWGDLIYHFGDDPHTQSIILYMESVGNARSFLSAAREVALTKPIIVVKVGRTSPAAKAAASHTGSLTGSDDVVEAAFRRAGILRVQTIGELFDMAEVLAKQPRPCGPRLAIVSNAGGPAALATDMLIANGGELAPLSVPTKIELDQMLPAHWSHSNPIDILGDADANRYVNAVEAAAHEPASDGVLVILTPQAMTDATATAERLKCFGHFRDKPVLASWMGGPNVDTGRAILNQAGIPTFDYPDIAARAFVYMWRYSKNLRTLYETPTLSKTASPNGEKPGRPSARVVGGSRGLKILQRIRQEGRTILTEVESKDVLRTYGIPTAPTYAAFSEEDAIGRAQQIGFPVVLKLLSETLTHKSDVGGVQLDLQNMSAVRRAWRAIESSVREKAGAQHFCGVTVQPMVRAAGYEIILGSSIDPQFGPVLLFGAGGTLVEAFQDHALGLPPLNTTLARRLMEQTRIYCALKGVRGSQSVDLPALEGLLVRFSQLVVEQKWIKEIDINPLFVNSEQSVALDARIVLHDHSVTEEQLPRPAIRPYPNQYVANYKLKDGTPVVVRPIRPEDEPLLSKFHRTLSEQSVYLRYFSPLKLEQRIAHERLSRLCFIDYDREMALVVERCDKKRGESEILAVGRLSKIHATNEAEFALIVSDLWQGHGLGTQLLRLLVQVGRDEKMERISATILAQNHSMQRLARRAGFELHSEGSGSEVRASLVL